MVIVEEAVELRDARTDGVGSALFRRQRQPNRQQM